jgi:tetratricopeptide (TPR) repeat protein
LYLEPSINPDWLSQLYDYYQQRKEEDKALNILRLGLERIPNYPKFHEWLGDHYVKQAITYRAIEEYQQALLLEPGNSALRSKIAQLSASSTR